MPSDFRSRLSAWRGTVCLLLGCAVCVLTESRGASAGPADPQPFTFLQEFYGSAGFEDPEVTLNLQQGMMNGITVWPPVQPAAAALVGSNGGLMLRLAGTPGPAGVSAGELDRHVAAFAGLSSIIPAPTLYWNLMPEWDQSGGPWVPEGRPNYSGLARPAAYERFLGYYNWTLPGLSAHLRQPPPQDRIYRLAAITDYCPNVYYGYELGAELQLLERGNDELGDLSTGIAFLRGAARQYGKSWGIDISTWRSSNNGATSYDYTGRLAGGWSAGYLERMYYIAYAAGAQVIHNEAATYRYPDGTLNPFGEVTRRFADFALRRHPGLGKPTVNIALMIDHYSGFDPKHGVHNQTNGVWYQDIPYSLGDYMTDGLLRAAFPGHWLHGLAPGAPFANADEVPEPGAFARFLALGGDPSPYEPMPATRWGDNVDIVTNHTPAAALSGYKVVFLTGDVAVDAGLRQALTTWVSQGGVLVINAAQTGSLGADLSGVQILSRVPKASSRSRWVSDSQSRPEPTYSYLPALADNASVLALTGSGDPLITSRSLGSGEVILTTSFYFQSAAGDQLLSIGLDLFDQLKNRFEPVRVSGPPIEFVVDRPAGGVAVTLANHSGSTWNGQISVPSPGQPGRVLEYVSDQTVPYHAKDGGIGINATVPPRSVRIFAVEQD